MFIAICLLNFRSCCSSDFYFLFSIPHFFLLFDNDSFVTDAIASSPPSTDDADLAALRSGAVLWKLRSSDAWYRRRYWVDTQKMRLLYEPSRKPFWCNAKQHIDVMEIKDARLGWKTGKKRNKIINDRQ